MTSYTSNVKAFVESARASSDPITKAYFGMVAIELILKESTGLRSHDVPGAIIDFANRYAVKKLSGCKVRLSSLSTQLSNDLAQIITNDKNRSPSITPSHCYPYLRYTRHQLDGWPVPVTTVAQAQKLASTVSQVQAYLREKFNKDL
jgi:hypothetical protein